MTKKKKTSTSESISVLNITNCIFFIRGQKVMLDEDLAMLYDVETRILTRAVKRNIERFPEDFMFQLDKQEFDNLRSQFGISNTVGGRRYPPYAFTEQGVEKKGTDLFFEKKGTDLFFI